MGWVVSKAHRRWNEKRAGQNAGRVNDDGYLMLSFEGQLLQAHRVAWALSRSIWPDGVIDHINHDRGDNRLSNLRDVPQSENMKNRWRGL